MHILKKIHNLFLYILKRLKIYQLNISKKIKKYCKKNLVKDIKIFLKNKKRKTATIWSLMLHKFSEDEKRKLVDDRKKYYKMRKNALLWL